jgi:hypothetical protein
MSLFNLMIGLGLASAPSPAENLMVQLTRSVCLEGTDPIAAAAASVPAGWEVSRRDRRDIVQNDTHGNPIPRHAVSSLKARGTVGGATFWVEVARTDYHDPAHVDHFSARFGVSPDTAIRLGAFQQRLPVTLEPRWSAIQGVEQPRLVLGTFTYPAQPRRYGWLQHYVVRPHRTDLLVEVTARHFSGREWPLQQFDMTCGTDIMETSRRARG